MTMITLTEARKALGLSITEFAAEAGLDRSFVWRVENRSQRCAPDSARSIHRAAKGLVSLESLLLGTCSTADKRPRNGRAVSAGRATRAIRRPTGESRRTHTR